MEGEMAIAKIQSFSGKEFFIRKVRTHWLGTDSAGERSQIYKAILL